MPSQLHEALIELFRQRPALVAEVLAGPLGVQLPAWRRARLDSGDLPEITPTEYRADSVVVLMDGDESVLAVVVEVQLRPDPAKRNSWPVYLTTLRARLRCPAILLVVCPNVSTSDWSAQPIHIGHPGWVLRPLVLGPRQVPLVVDPSQARANPELAVLAAMAHGAGDEQDKVLRALLSALDTIDPAQAGLYADIVLAALPAAARRHLEALMTTGTYEYQSDFARRYFFQGKAEGEVKALLAVLGARGLEIPEQARQRILSCSDLEQLDAWIRRAVTIDGIEELFA